MTRRQFRKCHKKLYKATSWLYFVRQLRVLKVAEGLFFGKETHERAEKWIFSSRLREPLAKTGRTRWIGLQRTIVWQLNFPRRWENVFSKRAILKIYKKSCFQ